MVRNTPEAVARLARKLVARHRTVEFAYEAGPCGYTLYRHLTRGTGLRSAMHKAALRVLRAPPDALLPAPAWPQAPGQSLRCRRLNEAGGRPIAVHDGGDFLQPHLCLLDR